MLQSKGQCSGLAACLNRLMHPKTIVQEEQLHLIFRPDCDCIDTMCIRTQSSR